MLKHHDESAHLNAHQKWWAFGFPVCYSINRRDTKA